MEEMNHDCNEIFGRNNIIFRSIIDADGVIIFDK